MLDHEERLIKEALDTSVTPHCDMQARVQARLRREKPRPLWKSLAPVALAAFLLVAAAAPVLVHSLASGSNNPPQVTSLPPTENKDVGNTTENLLNGGLAVEADKEVYYVGNTAGGKEGIYCRSKGSRDGTLLWEGEAGDSLRSLNLAGDRLYFLNLGNTNTWIYALDRNSRKIEKLYTGSGNMALAIADGNLIYLLKNSVFRTGLENPQFEQGTPLSQGTCYYMMVAGDDVYTVSTPKITSPNGAGYDPLFELHRISLKDGSDTKLKEMGESVFPQDILLLQKYALYGGNFPMGIEEGSLRSLNGNYYSDGKGIYTLSSGQSQKIYSGYAEFLNVADGILYFVDEKGKPNQLALVQEKTDGVSSAMAK